jgi:hypothetical protein
VRLKILNGHLDIGSLGAVGFASGAYPEWDALDPMRAVPQSVQAGKA